MTQASSTSNAANNMLAFILGASAGVTAALLFAPRRGQETRQQLKEKTIAARDKIQQQLAQKKETANEKVAEAAEKANLLLEGGHEKIETVRRRARQADASNVPPSL